MYVWFFSSELPETNRLRCKIQFLSELLAFKLDAFLHRSQPRSTNGWILQRHASLKIQSHGCIYHRHDCEHLFRRTNWQTSSDRIQAQRSLDMLRSGWTNDCGLAWSPSQLRIYLQLDLVGDLRNAFPMKVWRVWLIDYFPQLQVMTRDFRGTVQFSVYSVYIRPTLKFFSLGLLRQAPRLLWNDFYEKLQNGLDAIRVEWHWNCTNGSQWWTYLHEFNSHYLSHELISQISNFFLNFILYSP